MSDREILTFVEVQDARPVDTYVFGLNTTTLRRRGGDRMSRPALRFLLSHVKWSWAIALGYGASIYMHLLLN